MKFLPAGKLLLDTSVYIRYAREGALGWIADDRAAIKRTVLTVVVAAELYAGVRHPEAKRHLDALCRGHRTLGTLSCPEPEVWVEAGRMLGRYARLYGSVRMADHCRDGLIALEAAKQRATLVTENARDFSRWKMLLRAKGRALVVLDSRTVAQS